MPLNFFRQVTVSEYGSLFKIIEITINLQKLLIFLQVYFCNGTFLKMQIYLCKRGFDYLNLHVREN